MIAEETVVEVVAEASGNLADPNYSAAVVGSFVQSQATVAQFLGAHARELGGTEAVVQAIFHAALLGRCFERANHRGVPPLGIEDLHRVATDKREEELRARQPALLEYIGANVSSAPMRNLLILVALAMEWVS